MIKTTKKKPVKKESKKKFKKIAQSGFEKKVLELAKQELTSEKIGEKLRKENIHSKDFPKKISKILKENKTYINPDLKNVENKLEKLKIHFQTNKQDKRAKREIDRIAAQLRKLRKYFKIEIKKK